MENFFLKKILVHLTHRVKSTDQILKPWILDNIVDLSEVFKIENSCKKVMDSFGYNRVYKKMIEAENI